VLLDQLSFEAGLQNCRDIYVTPMLMSIRKWELADIYAAIRICFPYAYSWKPSEP